MPHAVAGSLKIRTVQYVSFSTLVDKLDLDSTAPTSVGQALREALSRDITWGDADHTLVHWCEVLDRYLEVVRDGCQLWGWTPAQRAECVEEAHREFLRILPSADFGVTYIDLEG